MISCLFSWSENDTFALTATVKPTDMTGSGSGAEADHEMSGQVLATTRMHILQDCAFSHMNVIWTYSFSCQLQPIQCHARFRTATFMNLGKLTSCIHDLPISAKHADNLKVLCACIDQCMPPLHRASDRCHLDYMVNTQGQVTSIGTASSLCSHLRCSSLRKSSGFWRKPQMQPWRRRPKP